MTLRLSRIAVPETRETRAALGCPYRLHQAVLAAFREGGGGRVLWRLEPERDRGRAVLLVQSEQVPEPCLWQAALGGAAVASRPYTPAFTAGERLCFRLRANPTTQAEGKRRAVRGEGMALFWLAKKLDWAGVRPAALAVTEEPPLVGRVKPVFFHSVRFDGELIVTDAAKLAAAVRAGLGPAKGFGFGLLSVVSG